MESAPTTEVKTEVTPCLSDRAFWSRPASERATTFAELRRVSPVSLQPASDVGPSVGKPYWAVTRHADVQYVSRHPALFESGQGVGLADVPQELLELTGSFIVMDAPRHTTLRRLVSAVFTPKRIARLAAAITSQAAVFVDQFVEMGRGDIVEDLATKLPFWTFCTMMGVPDEMRADLYVAVEAQIRSLDMGAADTSSDGRVSAAEGVMTMHRMARLLVVERRANPGDDILSALADSRVDGKPLSARELGALFVLFATAGYDTTRSVTSHGVKLFADNPEQWARLTRDAELVSPAVEEVIRCATPAIHFRRTATGRTRLADVDIMENEWVVLFYESANRDETVFPDPERFDVSRSPNPHVGFGGGGPHICIGAGLARVQLRALFARLSARVAAIEVGPPVYLQSPFHHDVKSMAVWVTLR